MSENWRVPQDMGDLLSSFNRRIRQLERRDGAAITIQNVMGATQAKTATLINDWNDEVASFNGYVWAHEGALHSPDPTKTFTGSVVARSDGSGMQEVWNTDDLNDVRYYMRTFIPDGTGQGSIFSEWRTWPTPSGLLELTDLGETVQDYLNDLAAEIDTKAESLRWYQQASAPVPGVGGVPAVLPVGSTWLDSDDNNHLYTWNGTAWISAESTLFAGLQSDIDDLTLAVEGANDAAANAMDFAETLNKTYRQATAPTSPDAAGRTLVTNDTWFDTGTAAVTMKRWSGSAWTAVDTSIALGSGTVVTGGTLQTEATASRGVKVTSGGLTAYNASGTATLVVNAATGAITMLGALTSGSTIDGAVVTGGTVQTEATAARGIKVNSSGLTAYDGSGNPTFTLVAATGAINLLGSLTGAGVITGPTLRGGLWETTGTALRGIKVTSTGMVAYNSSGTQTFFVDASSGVVTVSGGILTGGSITGGVVTGGLLQTDPGSGVGIKISSAGFTAYDNANLPTVVINAATGEVTLRGQLTATALTSLDNLSIQGNNNYLRDTLVATSALAPPSALINVSGDWPSVTTALPTGSGTFNVGLCPHHSDSNLLVTMIYDATGAIPKATFYSINKSTGAVTAMGDTDSNSTLHAWWWNSVDELAFYPYGLGMASGNYYLYGSANHGGQPDIVQRLTGSTLNPLGSEITGISPPGGFLGHPTLGMTYDATHAPTGFILMAQAVNSPSNVYVKTFTALDGSASSSANYSKPSWATGNVSLGGLIAGPLDFPSGTRFVIAPDGTQATAPTTDQNFVTSNLTSVAEDSTYRFQWAGGLAPTGICWDVGPTGDTARYIWSISKFGSIRLYRHGRNPAIEYFKAAYTWRDNNSTGLTHETLPGGARSDSLRPARTRLLITTPPAPQSGNGTQDAANMTGLYMMTAADATAANALALTALKLQDQTKATAANATQSTGYSGVDAANSTITIWRLLEAIKTTGTAPPTVNGFANIATVGKIQSQDFSSGNSALGLGWQFKGDGSLDGKRIGDTGWQNMTLTNSWVNYDSGLTTGGTGRTAQYCKINGIVYLRGVIRSGTMGASFFNMPAGYRPSSRTVRDKNFVVNSAAAFGMVGVDGDGYCYPDAGSNVYMYLDGCFWPADQ